MIVANQNMAVGVAKPEARVHFWQVRTFVQVDLQVMTTIVKIFQAQSYTRIHACLHARHGNAIVGNERKDVVFDVFSYIIIRA